MKESLIEREEGDELYEKVVRTGGNRYVYYYHNVKIKGKVRNVCLGTDLGSEKDFGKNNASEAENQETDIKYNRRLLETTAKNCMKSETGVRVDWSGGWL